MLNRETKKLILYFVLVFFFASCNNYKKYNIKEINSIRNNAVAMTKSLIGENEYWNIYNEMNDSINNWIDNKLGNCAYWNSLIKYQLDSILCINRERNKVVTAILLPYVGEGGQVDEIEYFYGVKIQEQWYFFGGATLVLPREYYQKYIYEPLSFEKLKQIATYNIYRGYLVKDEKGNWQINDKFFEYHFYNKGICSYCKTEEDFEKVWKYNALHQWNTKDTTSIK